MDAAAAVSKLAPLLLEVDCVPRCRQSSRRRDDQQGVVGGGEMKGTDFVPITSLSGRLRQVVFSRFTQHDPQGGVANRGNTIDSNDGVIESAVEFGGARLCVVSVVTAGRSP